MTTTMEKVHMPPKRRHNPHFLARQEDGKVRVRLTFTEGEAAMMEEASGRDDVVKWMHRTLQDGARRDIQSQRGDRPVAPPPEGA